MGCGCKNAESCGCSTMNAEGHKTVQCDFCSERKPLGQMKRMPYDPDQDKRVRYSGYQSTYAICDGCYRDRIRGTPVGKSVLHAESSTMNAETDRTILEQELFDLWATGKYDDWVSPDWSEAKEPFTKWAIANLPQFAPLGEKNAEESAVQEPDWIPDGDGRAIGQQNFGINLSPLHAEEESWGFVVVDGKGLRTDAFRTKAQARFYAQKSRDEAGRKGLRVVKAKKSDDRMNKAQMDIIFGKGWDAETVGTPSPTFNENITGQDGPSADPTNQTFEAMRTLAPSTRDVDSARRQLKNSGYGEVIYDRYIVNQQGSSNKFYYTAITEKDGKYFPMGAYGRIGYLGTLFNVAGKKENPYSHFGSMELAYRQIRGKEVSKINARKPEKRYVDYTLTRGAESLEEIEGPTAEATTGGLHSPSSFAMTWEDGSGQSSASIPPNEIAWAETSGIPIWIKVGAGIALVLAGKKLVSSRSSAQKAENNLKSAVKARKGCCGGSKTVRKDSEFSVGQINPVEVTGENDVYGAEALHSPQTSANVSQPNWGPQTTYLQNQRSNQKMW